MLQQIRSTYAKANTAFQAAKSLMDRGNLNEDEQKQADAHLDDVLKFTEEAKRLERVYEASKAFETPSQNLNAPAGAATTPQQKSPTDSWSPARKAVAKYWSQGFNSLTSDEQKALATAPGDVGGFVTEDHQRGEFLELLPPVVAMRRIGRTLPPIPGGSALAPTEENPLSDPEWTSEIKTGTDDTVKPFGGRTLTPHPLAKRVRVSRTLLRAGTLVDVERYVLERLATRFGAAQGNGFINGNGNKQPLGLLDAAAGIESVTTAGSTTLTADDLIEWVFTLPTAYTREAKILTNRNLIRVIRKLKDKDDQYLWQPGLSGGVPSTLLDIPYELDDYYPTGMSSGSFVANALVATIGAFRYYWIVDSLAFTVQRLDELYAESNQVGFIGRAESDGMPVIADAFRHLKIKA